MRNRRLIQVLFAASIVVAAAACGDMPSAPKDDDKVPCTEPAPHEGMVCVQLFGDTWGWN